MQFFELIKPGTNFDFMAKKNICIAISIFFILIGCISILVRGGLNYGIDFSGGLLLQLQFKTKVEIDDVRKALRKVGQGDSTIQRLGESDEIIITAKGSESDLGVLVRQINQSLEEEFSKDGFEMRKTETVGPKAGKDLRNKAAMAIIWAILGILAYIAFRFEFRFSVGAVIAMVHDVLITLGFLSLLDKEITLTIVAALLTIAGYSINDTVVIFDRIRENTATRRKFEFEEIINRSINETLGRTVLTGGSTLMTLIILSFLGGEVIHDFSLSLIVGIIAGTYSSIFIASPILVYWPGRSPSNVSAAKATKR
ncbi:MAG: protein translocase subunit SecF [Candidatus Tectomicrobia bacterium]|nr:protein translocase subunit SecF [Candidatus Tectomicrobia bacterium]